MRLESLDGERTFVIHDLLIAQECEALGFEAAE